MEKNFLGIKNAEIKKAKFVILPIPFELTTSFLKGTFFAPESIISVSEQLEFFDEELKIEPCESGIITLPPLEIDLKSSSSMMKKIEKEVKKILKKGKFLISIGGEHTITYGILNAFVNFHRDINVLILDAHSDLRDSYQNSKFSHACVSRRISESGVNLYILGVRSISKEEFLFVEKSENIKIFYSYRMKKIKWEEKIAKALPGGKYYISFDSDFFDPSLMPEVGTPEPGGFFWNETVNFLKNFIFRKDIEIVGFDFVELSPKNLYSPSSFIASKIIYKIMGIIYSDEIKTSG